MRYKHSEKAEKTKTIPEAKAERCRTSGMGGAAPKQKPPKKNKDIEFTIPLSSSDYKEPRPEKKAESRRAEPKKRRQNSGSDRRLSENRGANPAKPRRHKRNYILNYILVFIILGTAGFILSITVFFNLEAIEVNEGGGTEPMLLSAETTPKSAADAPSDDEIIAASGLKTGDNLITADLKKARQKVLDAYVGISDVQFSRKFPSGIAIEITMAEPKANIYYENQYYVLSEENRIIETSPSLPQNGVIKTVGIDLTGLDKGSALDADKQSWITELDAVIGAVEKNSMDKIYVADITDVMDIKLYYDSTYQIDLGGIENIEYKLYCAKSIIDQKLNGEIGVIDASVDNGTYYFRQTNKLEIP